MNKFIELHYQEDGKAFILNTDRIELVSSPGGMSPYVRIFYPDPEPGVTSHITVRETYQDVKKLLGIETSDSPEKVIGLEEKK